MQNEIKSICLSEQQINEITARLAKEISSDYDGMNPIFIGLLKGCVPFMTDLLKKVTIKCTQDYMKVSSYDGTTSTGNVSVIGHLPNVVDRNVIIIDDILDTGRTLNEVIKILYNKGAKSVNVCVLLNKPQGRVVNVEAKYIGDIVPNEFVVGYGLDYNEQYRNLPYIGVLKEEVYLK